MSARSILLVEDNPISRKLFRVVLSAEGYRVREAATAAEAIAQMREEPPDLALLDFLLPDASGVNLVRWLRAMPGGADMPVLGVTGFLSRIEQARAAGAGFDDYLAKPVMPSHLVAVVARFLGGDPPVCGEPSGGRVLVADDDATSRKLLCHQLRLAGYTVETASDGAEALNLCLRSPPSAVLADVLMPRLDGFKLCVAIRRNPRLAHVPVVLISAQCSEQADRALARKAGACAFVVRGPGDAGELAALRAALATPPPSAAATLPPAEYTECLLRQVERLHAVTRRSEERMAIQAASLTTLRAIADNLTRRPKPDEELEQILGDVLTAAGVSAGAIYLSAADGPSRAAVEYGHIEGGPSGASREEVCRRAVAADQAVAVAATDAEGVSAIAAPIGAGDARFGALLMLSSDRDLTAMEWASFAETVGGQIGHGIALGRMVAELRRGQGELEARVSARTEELRLTNDALRLARDSADAASRSKSAFLANMSHEIRTPMNAILGYTQLLQRDATLTPAQQQQFATIMRSGDHLLILVNDVLEMAKIEAGQRRLARGTVDTRRLIDNITRMFRLRVDNGRVRFEVTCAADVPARIVGDEGKLTQVLVNLLDNAVKFTQQGSVSLRVLTDPASPEPRLVAEVLDTGAGMTPEELAGLFRPFAQQRAGLQVSGGTGLGLALSRELARLMGGDVTVQSQVGQGSVFRLDVPIEISEAPVSDRPGPLVGRIVGILGESPRPRILLVDDDEVSRGWLRQLLESVGFEVREAVNGADAVASFAEQHPRLVLMDLHLPVMNGYEAMRAIRAHPAGGSTPIVVLTASAFDDERDAVFAAGADGWLRKPVREGDVLHEIAKHLGLRYETAAPPPPAVPFDDAPASVPLPPALVARLLGATHVGDYAQLCEVLAEIPGEHARLAAELSTLAEAFAYEEIERRLRG